MNDPCELSGAIVYAHNGRDRYAMKTPDGDYALFEVEGSFGLAVGQLVEGPIHSIGKQCLTVGGVVRITAVIKDVHQSQAIAAEWVKNGRPNAKMRIRSKKRAYGPDGSHSGPPDE